MVFKMDKLLLILCFSLICSFINAEDLHIVTEDFPPFNFQEEGVTKGLASEVVTAVLEEAKLSANIEFYPWARAYMLALHQKNHIIYSIARIPEREELFYWIGSISPYQTSFYKLKNRQDIQVASLEDAKRYLVGVSLADVTTVYLQEKGFSKLQMVPDDTQNLHKLTAGRVDLIAYEENSFLHKIHEQNLNPQDYERVWRVQDLTDELYMAISRNSDIKLFEKLRKALIRIKKSGTYEDIHQRYLKCQLSGDCK